VLYLQSYPRCLALSIFLTYVDKIIWPFWGTSVVALWFNFVVGHGEMKDWKPSHIFSLTFLGEGGTLTYVGQVQMGTFLSFFYIFFLWKEKSSPLKCCVRDKIVHWAFLLVFVGNSSITSKSLIFISGTFLMWTSHFESVASLCLLSNGLGSFFSPYSQQGSCGDLRTFIVFGDAMPFQLYAFSLERMILVVCLENHKSLVLPHITSIIWISSTSI